MVFKNNYFAVSPVTWHTTKLDVTAMAAVTLLLCAECQKRHTTLGFAVCVAAGARQRWSSPSATVPCTKSLPCAAHGKDFAVCFGHFAVCLRHTAKLLSPVVNHIVTS